MTDIIDLIDQAITPTCHQCGAELGDSLSNDFCGPDCQHAWHAARVDPLVGYEEPSDLPQHVHNLVELSSPETTPTETTYDSGDGIDVLDRLTGRDVFRSLREATRGRSVESQIVVASNPGMPTALQRYLINNRTHARGVPSHMTDDRTYHWIGPERQPFDPGAPWIRSPITPSAPATAVFIGGQRHGHAIGVPNPPRHTLEVIEALNDVPLFNSDVIRGERVLYQLKAHNGVHWCYVDPRPAAHQRTINADGHEPITIDYHHHNNARLMWWVTITGRSHGVVCELPDELLADDTALWVWFTERSQRGGYPITDGSWEITEPRPPFRREQT